MTDDQLLEAALRRPDPDERSAFLSDACAGDGERQRRLEALLAARLATSGFAYDSRSYAATAPFQPAVPASEELPSTAALGPAATGIVIAGRYVLEQKLGEGGMGEVWVARQSEPIKRRVALKLIKKGMDSQAVLARFEQERQALAVMDHPNIARVLDAGISDTGAPFFVMELVSGQPLTHFCDDERLTVRARLELFVTLCQAVQHAHQKGIVHRDLKPANILVTRVDGRPTPKIIDFGVAKAVSGKLTDETLATQYGSVVGTPEYMSPEQAGLAAADVDTRADIYSLGVILYELLTGLRPFDSKRLRKAAMDEIIRILREEEPPSLASRLSTAESLPSHAAARQLEPQRLLALVKGELDWIVHKCLEKDRNRRYETASGLARDLQRYLADEPVEARPISAGYRARKFIRRHRGAVLAGGAVVLALLLGLGAATAGLVWALRERNEKEQARQEESRQKEAAQANAKRAEEETERAKEAVADMRAFGLMLANDVLATARPKGERGGLGIGVTVRAAMDAAADKLGERFAGQPRAEALAQHTFGVTYRMNGEPEKAERHFRRAVELREAHQGRTSLDTLDSRLSLGVTLGRLERHKEALTLHEETLRRYREKLGADHASTVACQCAYADAVGGVGRRGEAIDLLKDCLRRSTATLGPDNPDALHYKNNLAVALLGADRNAEALPLFEELLRQHQAQGGPDTLQALRCRNNLGKIYSIAGRTREAIPLLEQGWKGFVEFVGPDHPDTLTCFSNYASALTDLKHFAQTVPLYEQHLPLLEARRGKGHSDTLRAMNNLALAYQRTNQLPKAVALFRETLSRNVASKEAYAPNLYQTQINLASALQDQGKLVEALALYEEAVPKLRAAEGADHPNVLTAQNDFATALYVNRQLDRSVPLFQETHRRRLAVLGPDDPETLLTAYNLAVNLLEKGDLPEAQRLLDDCLTRRLKLLGPAESEVLQTQFVLAIVHARARRFAAAADLMDARLKTQRGLLKDGDPALLVTLGRLGEWRLAAGEASLAETAFREVLKHAENRSPQTWSTFNTSSLLGEALLAQKRYAEAEPLLRAGYVGLKERQTDIPAAQRPTRLGDALERLVRWAEATGKPEDAERWRKELETLKAPTPAKPAPSSTVKEPRRP